MALLKSLGYNPYAVLPLLLLLLLLSTLELCKFGHGADVFVLHPKYPDDGDGHEASFLSRDAARIGRSLLVDKSALFQLQGNVVPVGLYYVTVNLGNPPSPYFLDVDSGSDLTWVQCDAPCSSCAKGPHPLYKPQKDGLVNKRDALCVAVQTIAGPSRQYKIPSQQCDYEIEYADRGTSYGVLVRDFVRFPLADKTILRASSVFGCSYDQRGPLAKSPSPTDGIMGLGSGTASLPSQWAKQGIVKNMIGHCISGGGRGGGYMFFGDELIPSSMTWVPMIGKPSMRHYYVGVAQMNVGSRVLDKGSDGRRLGGIIFDSGSSFTYFTNQAYSLFLSALRESIQGKPLYPDTSDSTLPVCWKGRKQFKAITDVAVYFKPLVLSFGSSSFFASKKHFEIAPEGYLVISRRGNACLGILNGTNIGVGNKNILGDVSLQGYLVVYDNERNRIGWTRADCQRIPTGTRQRRALLESGEQLDDEDDIEDSLTNEDHLSIQGTIQDQTNICTEKLGNAACSASAPYSFVDEYLPNNCMGSA